MVKHFSLADVLFLGGHPRFGYIYFPLAGVFYLGRCLRLESSCIWVHMVYCFIMH